MQRLITAVLFLVLAALPTAAFPWGSATHVHVLKRAARTEVAPAAMYGAMAVDVFEGVAADRDYRTLSREAHYSYFKLFLRGRNRTERQFGVGFMAHSEAGGADAWAHRRAGALYPEGYVTAKVSILEATAREALEGIFRDASVPFPELLAASYARDFAHALVETAVDILVSTRDDLVLGQDVYRAATTRPPNLPNLLVSAFAGSLSTATGRSVDSVAQLIIDAEETFREMTAGYGEVLAGTEEGAVQGLAEMGSALLGSLASQITGREVSIPPETLVALIRRAMEETEGDYRAVLDSVAWSLRGRLFLFLPVLRP